MNQLSSIASGYIMANMVMFLVVYLVSFFIRRNTFGRIKKEHGELGADADIVVTLLFVSTSFIPVYVYCYIIRPLCLHINAAASRRRLHRSLNGTIRAMEKDIILGRPVEVSANNISFLKERLRVLNTFGMGSSPRKEKQKILLILHYVENYGSK